MGLGDIATRSYGIMVIFQGDDRFMISNFVYTIKIEDY